MKTILTITIGLFFFRLAIAQDVIVTKKGEEIKAKVLEVNSNDVKYKKYLSNNDSLNSILVADLTEIIYENGSKNMFNSLLNSSLATTNNLNTTDYLDAKNDVDKYYLNYKTAGTATLLSTIILGLTGAVPALILSKKTPIKTNLGYPDSIKFNTNIIYRENYIKLAQERNQKKFGKII